MRRVLFSSWHLFLFVLIASAAGAKSHTVRILYVNDFHGFAEPRPPLGSHELVGGAEPLAARVETLRKERPSVLLAAGDMIQGDSWANLSLGASSIALMNAMKFDAMTAGNHEFDFGPEALSLRISEASFPVLGANVEGPVPLKPYAILERSGVRIAVLGLVTADTPSATHPRNVEGLRFLPPEETLRRTLRELRERADVVVLLTHLGHSADRALAESAPGADVIVGGHSHTRVEKPVVIGQCIVVQAWEHAKALGVLDLTVEDGKVVAFEGRLEEIRPGADREHLAARDIVARYAGRVETELGRAVGQAAAELDGENVRARETNLGNLLADIVRQASGADAAILNGGGIRAGIRKGEVRVRDVFAALPFDNYIVAVRLTGLQLREALEYGVSAVERREGRFPQVSGVTFTYAPSAPPGSRVQEVRVGAAPVEPARAYTVATNDFLAAGGDGYRAFGDAVRASPGFSVIGGAMTGDAVVFSDAGRLIRDAVIDHWRQAGSVAPVAEGRIKEVE